jgi:hypothetical protein
VQQLIQEQAEHPVSNSINSGIIRNKKEQMIYCVRDSADSFYMALTIGKKYLVTSLHTISVEKEFQVFVSDDNNKVVNLSSTNFCSLEYWRDKKIDKILW